VSAYFFLSAENTTYPVGVGSGKSYGKENFTGYETFTCSSYLGHLNGCETSLDERWNS
jgi:hypothetical protein